MLIYRLTDIIKVIWIRDKVICMPSSDTEKSGNSPSPEAKKKAEESLKSDACSSENKKNAEKSGQKGADAASGTQKAPPEENSAGAKIAQAAETSEDARASDVITQSDFKNIEEKYAKKPGILSKIFKKGESAPEESPQEDALETKKSGSKDMISALSDLGKRLDDFTFRLDKQDGKFEAESGFREAMNERMSSFAEELGELRSMILDREKSFNDIQVGFERINDTTREIQPEKIRAEFEKSEKALIDNTIKVEKVELFINSLKEELKNYRLQMSKVKSFDNLLEVIQKIKEELNQISESKNYIDRKAAKVESIFSDLNERLGNFNKAEAKIEKLDALTQDLMKSVDKIETRLEEVALKEDVNKKLDPLVASSSEDAKKLASLADTVSRMASKLERINADEIDALKKEIVCIDQVLESIEKRIPEPAPEGVQDKAPGMAAEPAGAQHRQESFFSMMHIPENLLRRENARESGSASQAKSTEPAANGAEATAAQQKIHEGSVAGDNAPAPRAVQAKKDAPVAEIRADAQRPAVKGSFQYTYEDSEDDVSAGQNAPDVEEEITRHLVLAKSSISEYNFGAAKKNYAAIYLLLAPLLRKSSSEYVRALSEASKELYTVLYVPGTSPAKFKQMVSDLKAGCSNAQRA